MNPRHETRERDAIQEAVIANGLEGILPALKLLLDFARRQVRAQFLQATPYERTATRQGYANGYKPKTIHTRRGSLTVEIPQVRGRQFYPQSLEKGCRSERALKLALAERYLRGVSTGKVTKITEALCGLDISATRVSRLTKELAETVEAFRNRPLGSFEYVYLDARYEKGRQGGVERNLVVLIAVGANPGQPREVSGVSASLSGAEVYWRDFHKSMVKRGLEGVKLIIGDDHWDLTATPKAVFPFALWPRCQFHLQRNTRGHIPKRSLKKPRA